MSKSEKKKLYYDLGKNPSIKLLSGLISLIDGYLAYFFDDPDPFDQPIRKGAIGKEFANEWKTIYKTLYKMAYTLKRLPEIKKYVFAQGALRSFSLPLTLMGAIFAIYSMFPGVPINPLFLLISGFALACIGAFFLIMSWYMGKKVAETIDKYFKDHREKYSIKRTYLRDVVQKLLYSLAFYLKNNDFDLDKYKFKLFNSFYKGIIVLKKPGLFRKKYVVKFNVKDLPFKT